MSQPSQICTHDDFNKISIGACVAAFMSASKQKSNNYSFQFLMIQLKMSLKISI